MQNGIHNCSLKDAAVFTHLAIFISPTSLFFLKTKGNSPLFHLKFCAVAVKIGLNWGDMTNAIV